MTDEAVAILREIQWIGTAADGLPCCPLCGAPAATRIHAPGCRLANSLSEPSAVRWRHKKRGTTYREIGHATLQHSGGMLDDQDVMVVYRSEGDGTLGVRSIIEFSDGRFERLD